MIRITVEQIYRPEPIPKDPTRRTGDILHPSSLVEPQVTVLYQQEWSEDITAPDVRDLVAHIHGLAYQPVCRRCGHPVERHAQGKGKCGAIEDVSMYTTKTCDCTRVMTDADEFRAELGHGQKEYGKLEGRVQHLVRESKERDTRIAKLEHRLQRNGLSTR